MCSLVKLFVLFSVLLFGRLFANNSLRPGSTGLDNHELGMVTSRRGIGCLGVLAQGGWAGRGCGNHRGLMVNGGLGNILWRFLGVCGTIVAKSQVTIFPVRAAPSPCQIREKSKIWGIVAGKWGQRREETRWSLEILEAPLNLREAGRKGAEINKHELLGEKRVLAGVVLFLIYIILEQ